MDKIRQTKIVCTLGPASDSQGVLEQMVCAGMNVARFNFSHGTHEEHRLRMARLRRAAKRAGRTVAILQDLSGPKIRLGEVAGGTAVELQSGASFLLTERTVPGDAATATVQFKGLARIVRKGDPILLNDGYVELRVARVEGRDILCEVVNGGPISSHKGVNLPARSTGIPALTPKDKADMAFGLAQGVDFLALSFVRSARDITAARKHAASLGYAPAIIAKIEKPEALENLGAIIAEADGVMVARGDLGVETPYEQVPTAERLILALANAAGKPVITATQMLESMTASPRPTRAEVTDVYSAVMLGTDAVMLSEESASGRYPVQAVAALARIALEAEKHFPHGKWGEHFPVATGPHRIAEALARQAVRTVPEAAAALLVVHSVSGMTARLAAKYRPPVPLVAVSGSPGVCRRLALSRGVLPLLIRNAADPLKLFNEVVRTVRRHVDLGAGERIVMTYGHPLDAAGGTDSLRVITVP